MYVADDEALDISSPIVATKGDVVNAAPGFMIFPRIIIISET